MTDKLNTETALSVENVKLTLENVGFSTGELSDLINTYGGDVLHLIADGIEKGFTKDFLIEILSTAGPLLLDILNTFMGSKLKLATVVPLAGEEVTSFTDTMQSLLLDTFVKKILPILMEKIGPYLADILTELIIKALSK